MFHENFDDDQEAPVLGRLSRCAGCTQARYATAEDLQPIPKQREGA
jgi:hypothetical protein